MSLARRDGRADFPEALLQLLDPSEWTLAAYGGFFREENIIVLEARVLMYAVRYAESNYSTGRLLILFDSLALVLALCKGRSTFFKVAFSVMRRIFASGFGAGFCLIVQPSVLNYSDKRSRFFDRDYHVLAQLLTRSSPARTSDQDCFSHAPGCC